jgi:hypothetical protein
MFDNAPTHVLHGPLERDPAPDPSPLNEALAALVYVFVWTAVAIAIPVIAMVWQAWL